MLNFLLDLGISNYYSQRLAEDKSGLIKSFMGLTRTRLILALCYGLFLLFTGIITGVESLDILVILGLNQFLFALFVFLRSTVAALQLYKSDAVLSVLDKLIMILVAGLMIYFPGIAGEITIERFIVIQVSAITLSILVAFFIIIKNNIIDFKAKGPGIIVIKQAVPFALIILFMSAHSRQDAFLLERLHENGRYESGIYAAAYRLLDACNTAGYLVAVFLFPFIARNKMDVFLTGEIIRKCRNLLLTCALLLIAVSWVYSDQIYLLLYHPDSTYAPGVFAITMLSLAGYYLVHVYGTYLTATGNLRQLIAASVFFMGLNFLSNIIFIPSYGAKACAGIAFITQTCYGVVLWIMVKRLQRRITISIINA